MIQRKKFLAAAPAIMRDKAKWHVQSFSREKMSSAQMCKCIFLLRFFVAPVSLFPAIYDALVPMQQSVQQSVSHYVVQHMQAILNPRIVYFRGKRRKEKKPSAVDPRKSQTAPTAHQWLPSPPLPLRRSRSCQSPNERKRTSKGDI